MRKIYLDYNATTPIAPAVQEAMLPFLAENFGNPSSGHPQGRASREAVEDARTRLATLLGATPDEIVFTSGGTEANNLAIKGLLFQRGLPQGHVVISALEHPAVAAPANFLKRLGVDVTVVGCDESGTVRAEDVAGAIRPDTVLVSVMHANNEIGSVQPIAKIADICRQRGVRCHSDAAQTVGKIPVRVDALGVDMLTVAGHKMYAPKGVGALYLRHGVALEPVLHGAGHERGLRPGTENVASIVGLGRAASVAGEHLDEAAERISRLRDRLEARLRRAVGAGLTINACGGQRLPNTCSANFPGVDGNQLLARAPEVYASTGAACHAGTATLSATLAAIGLSPQVGRGTVRLSVGWYTDEEQIDRAADALISAWETLQ